MSRVLVGEGGGVGLAGFEVINTPVWVIRVAVEVVVGRVEVIGEVMLAAVVRGNCRRGLYLEQSKL